MIKEKYISRGPRRKYVKAMKKKLKSTKGTLRPAMSDSFYDKKQLSIGTKIEMEHTRSKKTAKRIAKHHLDEYPTYYVELIKMEKKLEKKKEVKG